VGGGDKLEVRPQSSSGRLALPDNRYARDIYGTVDLSRCVSRHLAKFALFLAFSTILSHSRALTAGQPVNWRHIRALLGSSGLPDQPMERKK
jgi:hypothetical protein